MFFPANYGGAAMESIPIINGTHSRDEKETFPRGGRRNDLRLKCGALKDSGKQHYRKVAVGYMCG